MPFPRIKVSGTPYECGRQMGQQLEKQIRQCLQAYQDLFFQIGHLSWKEAVQRSEKFIPAIEKYDADLLKEMKGIADELNLSLGDIIALNARSEVLFSSQAVDGCTSLAVVPPLTDKHHTFLAQNWDHYGRLHDTIAIIEIVQPNRPKILMVTEAGIIGKIGFNSAGIGVCLNALGSEGEEGGLPIHLGLRGVLNSRTIGEAIGASIQQKSANAANFLIASHEGESVDIELANDAYDVIYNESYLSHTNHFISPRLIHIKDRVQEINPDSHIRLGVAKKLLAKYSTNQAIKIEDIKSILGSHVNYPDSICRHGESADLSKGKRGSLIETIFSIIMDLNDLKMWVSPGTPCTTPYVELTFEQERSY